MKATKDTIINITVWNSNDDFQSDGLETKAQLLEDAHYDEDLGTDVARVKFSNGQEVVAELDVYCGWNVEL